MKGLEPSYSAPQTQPITILDTSVYKKAPDFSRAFTVQCQIIKSHIYTIEALSTGVVGRNQNCVC